MSVRSRLAGIAILLALPLRAAETPALPLISAPGARGVAATPLGPGFAPDDRRERDIEERFAAEIVPEKIRSTLRSLTEEPHVAGTPADRRTAELVRDRWKEDGFETEIVPYEVLLNYPKNVSLRLLAPEEKDLPLREDGNTHDKD